MLALATSASTVLVASDLIVLERLSPSAMILFFIASASDLALSNSDDNEGRFRFEVVETVEFFSEEKCYKFTDYSN